MSVILNNTSGIRSVVIVFNKVQGVTKESYLSDMMKHLNSNYLHIININIVCIIEKEKLHLLFSEKKTIRPSFFPDKSQHLK